MRTSVAAFTLAVLAGTPCAVSAQATTRDFAWLTGAWEGKMTGQTNVAYIAFTPPTAGVITGTMRLFDPQGKLIVIELLTMIDTPDGMQMRFRHFSGTLEAYEPTFKQNMRLTAHREGDRDTFENETAYDKSLMSTQPRITSFIRHGKDEFVGHSDIINDDGKPAVVEVTYRRAR